SPSTRDSSVHSPPGVSEAQAKASARPLLAARAAVAVFRRTVGVDVAVLAGRAGAARIAAAVDVGLDPVLHTVVQVRAGAAVAVASGQAGRRVEVVGAGA